MSELEKKKEDIEKMLKQDIYKKYGQKPQKPEARKFTKIMRKAYEKEEVVVIRDNSRKMQIKQTEPSIFNFDERKSSVIVRPSSKLGLNTVD